MAEYGLATISILTPHHRLRPRAADLPRPWNTTQPSPISATHIGKRLAGKLHEPFERAGGGRAISPTSPDSTKGPSPGRSATTRMRRFRPFAYPDFRRRRSTAPVGRRSYCSSIHTMRVAQAARSVWRFRSQEQYSGFSVLGFGSTILKEPLQRLPPRRQIAVSLQRA